MPRYHLKLAKAGDPDEWMVLCPDDGTIAMPAEEYEECGYAPKVYHDEGEAIARGEHVLAAYPGHYDSFEVVPID